MTLDDLYFIVQVKRILEFKHKDITYRLSYDEDSQGNLLIKFGPQFEETVYKSYGEFINDAKVENFALKYYIEDIDLKKI